MTTTTLSSRSRFKNLLKGMLRKNIPTAVYLSVIFFLVFPLQMVLDTMNVAERITSAAGPQMDVINSSGPMMRAANLVMGIYTDVSVVMVVIILVLGAFVMGLVQSSYLHSKRAVDLYHSLPVTRTELMSANILTAFLTVMVPFFLNYILNLCAAFYRQSILGSYAQAVSPYVVFWDLLGWCVSVFAILAVVMLVSTQVGSIFENFIFAGELLAAPVVIILINELLCQEFLVGYVSKINYRFVFASSPASLMVGVFSELGINVLTSHFFAIAILVWAVLGAAIFAAALYLGRRRKSEIAESSGCKGIVGDILTAIAVYIGGMGAGTLLYATFNTDGEAAYLVSVVIGAVLVFFLAEAILNRGFGGIRKTLPLGAVCTAFIFAATFAITSGGLGYETRVPAVDKVESVSFDYRGWYDYVTELDASTKTDHADSRTQIQRYSYQDISRVELKTPEAIELVRQIHLSMVDADRNNTIDYRSNYNMIQYEQKNGGTIVRHYDGYDENTLVLLQQLNETAEFQEQTNPVLRIKSDTIRSMSLHNSLGFVKYELGISRDMGTLLEAMRQDARANGTRDFTAGSPVLGYIYIDTGGEEPTGSRELTENLIVNFSVPVFASSTSTIAALNSMGKEDALGAPDLSEVTEVGFDRYSNWIKNTSMAVAGVGTMSADKKNHDYLITDVSGIKPAIDGASRFVVRSDYYSDDNNRQVVYLTLYNGDEAGITVMSPLELLPQSVKDLFPELFNRSGDKTVTFNY